MTETIAIISGKGGVGKTTLTANLGSVMAHVMGKNVTIIDTDVTGSHLGIHMGFQFTPATLNSVLRGEHEPKESVYEHETGVKLVPGALNYDDAKGVDVYYLKEIVAEYKDDADVILLDCSPGLDRESSAAIRAADRVLYISRPSFTSVIDIVRTQTMVEDLDSESIGVVLNMVKGRSYEIDASDVEGFANMTVVGTIPYDETLEKAAAQGTPITLYDPHCRASRAIEDLAFKLLDEDPKERKKGFYRRLRESIPGL